MWMHSKVYEAIRDAILHVPKEQAAFMGDVVTCHQLPKGPREGDVWQVRLCDRLFIWDNGSWSRMDTVQNLLHKDYTCPTDCDANSLVARLAWK